MEGVDNVVETFEAEVKAALRHKAALDKHMAALYDLLPAMRLAKVGPTEIERMSQGLIPRDTASRRTASVIGTSRKKDAPAGS